MRAARRGVAADESEREAVASAALLPLLRQQEDIVHLVLRHWQWALLLDKLLLGISQEIITHQGEPTSAAT